MSSTTKEPVDLVKPLPTTKSPRKRSLQFSVSGSISQHQDFIFVPLSATPNADLEDFLGGEEQEFLFLHAPISSGKTTAMINLLENRSTQFAPLLISLSYVCLNVTSLTELFNKLYVVTSGCCLAQHNKKLRPFADAFEFFVALNTLSQELGKKWVLVLDDFEAVLELPSDVRTQFLACLRALRVMNQSLAPSNSIQGQESSVDSSLQQETSFSQQQHGCKAIIGLGSFSSVLLDCRSPFYAHEIRRLNFWDHTTLPVLLNIINEHTRFRIDLEVLQAIHAFTAGQPGFMMIVLRAFGDFLVESDLEAMSMKNWQKLMSKPNPLAAFVNMLSTTRRICNTLKSLKEEVLVRIICAEVLTRTTEEERACYTELVDAGILETKDQARFTLISPFVKHLAREVLVERAISSPMPPLDFLTFIDGADPENFDLELICLLVIRSFGPNVAAAAKFAAKKDFSCGGKTTKLIQTEAVFHEEFFKILSRWSVYFATVVTQHAITSNQYDITLIPDGWDSTYLVEIGAGNGPTQAEHIGRLQNICATNATKCCYINFTRADDHSALDKPSSICSNINVVLEDLHFTRVKVTVFKSTTKGVKSLTIQDFMNKSHEEIAKLFSLAL